MQPTDELLDQLQREDVADARRMSFADKFLAGAELFDYACRITMAGIRNQNPGFNEQQILDELRRRVAMGEYFDNLPGRGE
jgi:hypothetical protein